jgi:hypothetical protein
MFKKSILIIGLLTSFLFSNQLDLNDKIKEFNIVDQFDKIHKVTPSISIIIVSFEKGTGAEVNEFLSKKKSDYLKKHNAVFIANISAMPSIITKLFALPKMRKYKHTILLIYDEKNKQFLQKEEKSTLYKIKDGVVENITYIDASDLEKVFN